MIHSKYSGLIKCKKCGKNYKSKKERGVQKYICAGYDRNGVSFCEREMVTETILDELIELHFRRKLNGKELRDEVVNIEIHKENKWIINYSDGSQTIRTRQFLKI